MKSNKWGRLSATSALLAVGCSRALAPEGHYQATPVAIDGEISDWGLPLRVDSRIMGWLAA